MAFAYKRLLDSTKISDSAAAVYTNSGGVQNVIRTIKFNSVTFEISCSAENMLMR